MTDEKQQTAEEDVTKAYPLSWPDGWPRTSDDDRERARFRENRDALTVSRAIKRLLVELGRMRAEHVVISSNVELRRDGLPYSGRRPPKDPGAACYFRLDDVPYCLPCDKWDRVADNLAAMASHVSAMRGMERWGVGSVAQQFAGFRALPPKGGTTVCEQGPSWWHVLRVSRDAKIDEIQAAYRVLARKNHPDAGGDAGAMAAINRAWEQAKEQNGIEV
jgi:hypothetical protein